MLTDQMKTLIRQFSAGSVATVNADGTPTVSPKATFVIVDNKTLAFGNIRSPRTLANLRGNPAVEVCFTDIVTRKAVRVKGTADIQRKSEASAAMQHLFETEWKDVAPLMSAFVVIDVLAAELILSPAYDRGMTEQALKTANLEHLNAL